MNDPVLELLEGIVKSIVDSPESVEFKRVEANNKIVYYVTPKQGEAGQVIGSKGSLASCIRSIIKAAARRYRSKDVYLDVIDLNREQF